MSNEVGDSVVHVVVEIHRTVGEMVEAEQREVAANSAVEAGFATAQEDWHKVEVEFALSFRTCNIGGIICEAMRAIYTRVFLPRPYTNSITRIIRP
jgi:hypothetical protein